MVRAPGPMRSGLGSGLVGDTIGNQKLHGGDDQAVYVYAREDLDQWEAELARSLTNGMFGENLTTSGVDVTGARIGERWRIGSDGPLLEVSAPRTPCRTFSAFLQLDKLDQDIHQGGETRCLSSGYLTGYGARRRRDIDRFPPRSRCDDRPGIPRQDVGPGSASAPVAGRCAFCRAQGLRASARRSVTSSGARSTENDRAPYGFVTSDQQPHSSQCMPPPQCEVCAKDEPPP